ncbi:MAG: branched-chain amino acid transporter permease [Ilumatobacteraceae bacterium]|jgi:branched-chain amino acid transport system permease protein|nr:branched-chain amino acid transporter permease [Ilumatobacteraceae bacterium]
MAEFLQQLINGISLGSVYALLALGVTLVWGVLDVLNFAHAQFMTWGTFGTVLFLNRGYSVIVSVLLGMLVAAVLAIVVEEAVVSPLRRRSSDLFAPVVATIGVGFILETALKMRTDGELRPFPRTGFPTGSIAIGNVNVPKLQLVVLITTIVVMVLLGLWLGRTRNGRELRAVAYSREISELLGVNARVSFMTAFAVSGALAALAGTFVSVQTSLISYSSGGPLLLVIFAAIVIGGMGSVPGAVLGGLVLGVSQVMTSAYVSSELADAASFILMLLVLLIRPTGLIPQKAASRA